ncbi:hypothetical protein [Hydrococcus rivularis]|nr:hypothetical protein [Hydrococcus rivularis]
MISSQLVNSSGYNTIFHSLMTEMVDRPHPSPFSQIGRGEKNVDRD